MFKNAMPGGAWCAVLRSARNALLPAAPETTNARLNNAAAAIPQPETICQDLPRIAAAPMPASTAMTGVIGTQKFSYDIWGDTVNMAARIERSGEQGCINISSAAWQQIMHRCRGVSKQVDVKGKGVMDVIVLKGMSKER